MSASEELHHLIKMINQIADSLSVGDNSGCNETVADKAMQHVKSFWARPMKEQILQYAKDGGPELNPTAKLAVAKLDSVYQPRQ